MQKVDKMNQDLRLRYPELRKRVMVDAAKAYMQSTPHHQIECDIIANLKYDDPLYLENISGWELHANCPDYLESLDLRLALYQLDDTPKDAALIKLWVETEYHPMFLAFRRESNFYMGYVANFIKDLGISNPPELTPEMSGLKFIEKAYYAYIEEFLK